MSFSDHKITQFTHKITDLPDQPSLPANELKARFDSSPEELRQAVNGICDEASRLEARVEGIVVDTFGDTIDREMLSDELAAELDAKATQTALTGVDSRLQTAESTLQTHTTQLTQKSELYFGTYTGTGTSATKTVSLGFTPKAVLVVAYQSKYDGEYNRTTVQLAVQGANAKIVSIVSGGFTVTNELNDSTSSANPYRYLALK